MTGQLAHSTWTEETFRALTEQSVDIVSLLDASGRLLFSSAASARISGFTSKELDGIDTFEFIHPEDRDAIRREMVVLLSNPESQTTVQYRYRHKSGGWTWMEAVATNQLHNPKVNAIVTNSRDISERIAIEKERRQLAEHLSQVHALENLATLAGGIAHDFNNLLSVVLGETEMLKMETDESERQTSLESVCKAARRAAELTSLLLTYAGRGRIRCEPVDLVSFVAECEPKLKRIMGQSNQLSVTTEGNVSYIDADRNKLWQILESLVTNSVEGVDGPGCSVRICVGMTFLTRRELQCTSFDSQQEPGPFVYLEVMDTACGMEPAVVQKIFEPFFSTKGIGRGLGLAAVAGLVRSLRGGIKVHSEPKVGTTFTLYFRSSREFSAPQRQPRANWRGDGLALVIDDETQVANVTARVLASLGFSTAVACGGVDAIQLFGHRLDEVRVVLLDMIMPNMNGGETFRCLRKLRPHLPVLFYSGYPGDVAQEELLATNTCFLQKPFSRDLLGITLQQLLDKES